MAELVFYYGAMGSSKTANALMQEFNLRQNGFNPWLITPAINTRDVSMVNGKMYYKIKSRIGLESSAQAIKFDELIQTEVGINAIICDEAQFLTPKQIESLKIISETQNIPVYCYGLRTDFTSGLFAGSKRLFELADRLVELDTTCACGNRAIISTRIKNGKPVLHGGQIDIGGDEKYKAMCFSCWIKQMCE